MPYMMPLCKCVVSADLSLQWTRLDPLCDASAPALASARPGH